MARILIVEDDEDTRSVLSTWVASEGHEACAAICGKDASYELNRSQFDLIILDWELPDTNGISLLRQIRSKNKTVPVLMLTGRSSIDDKEVGLDTGADDYLTKPFSVREFAARVRAQLRRATTALSETGTLSAGSIELNCDTHRVTRDGVEIDLRPLEFALLEFLMKNQGKVFSSERLINCVWPQNTESGDEAVRSVVKQIRKKIDHQQDKESIIKNVHGLGYKLEHYS